jgi:hypothetical protein
MKSLTKKGATWAPFLLLKNRSDGWWARQDLNLHLHGLRQ